MTSEMYSSLHPSGKHHKSISKLLENHTNIYSTSKSKNDCLQIESLQDLFPKVSVPIKVGPFIVQTYKEKPKSYIT